eukprot:11629757-Heterocapsa_arctica.AAC.1
MEMTPARRSQCDDQVTVGELAELRAKIGSLSWLAWNTTPDLACVTSELQSEVTGATYMTF